MFFSDEMMLQIIVLNWLFNVDFLICSQLKWLHLLLFFNLLIKHFFSLIVFYRLISIFQLICKKLASVIIYDTSNVLSRESNLKLVHSIAFGFHQGNFIFKLKSVTKKS